MNFNAGHEALMRERNPEAHRHQRGREEAHLPQYCDVYFFTWLPEVMTGLLPSK